MGERRGEGEDSVMMKKKKKKTGTEKKINERNERRESREERRGGREHSHYGHKFNTGVNCFPSKTQKMERKCFISTKKGLKI